MKPQKQKKTQETRQEALKKEFEEKFGTEIQKMNTWVEKHQKDRAGLVFCLSIMDDEGKSHGVHSFRMMSEDNPDLTAMYAIFTDPTRFLALLVLTANRMNRFLGRGVGSNLSCFPILP